MPIDRFAQSGIIYYLAFYAPQFLCLLCHFMRLTPLLLPLPFMVVKSVAMTLSVKFNMFILRLKMYKIIRISVSYLQKDFGPQ
jgi:hypothetical protein